MIRISTYSRLSLGLVSLLFLILSGAYFLNLIPDKKELLIAKRQSMVESLAVVCTKSAERGYIDTLEDTLRAFVERNDGVLSAALRKADNTLLAEAGQHDMYWQDVIPDRSTPTHVSVPIYQGDKTWGNVEVVFKAIGGTGFFGYFQDPNVQLTLFVLIVGFILYRLFLKRVLKQMDPTSVVPPRVRAALDTMVEGIALLDHHARIVLTNENLSRKAQKPIEQLVGLSIDEFNWEPVDQKDKDAPFPWTRTLDTKKRQIGVPLQHFDENGRRSLYMVNTSPIIDQVGRIRGVLATFDDVTQVEEKNTQLKQMVQQLQNYSDKIKQQNLKLEFLATRDHLTGCHNRRSFFDAFNKDFSSALRYKHALACVMMDIDHFKSVNDTHGHAAGDNVLRGVSTRVLQMVRKMDTVGRYGGEEFCIILPHMNLEKAIQAAERFRAKIEEKDFSGIKVTASFGVASLGINLERPEELIDQADRALYEAKKSGRNRVVAWRLGSKELPCKETDQTLDSGETVDNHQTAPAEEAPQPSAEVSREAANRTVVRIINDDRALPASAESGEGNAKAIKLVHAGLSEAGRNGMQATGTDEGAAVQLNKNGGWGGDGEAEEPRQLANRRSMKQVAKVLNVRSQN